MNFENVLEKIFSIKSFKGEATLERMKRIMDYLGNPQNQLKFVHVAGTNGKGSICTLIANVLEQNGYTTGKFISPYIVDFRERIQINNSMISKNDLIKYYNIVSEAQTSTNISLTQFEFITVMAIVYFRDKNTDVVVLEVGMGGRFDATNVIKSPEVAVIASISLDHTEILGDTVEKIAYEKSGIIKNKGTVVCYPVGQSKAIEVVKERASQEEAELIVPKVSEISNIKCSFDGSFFSYKGEDYALKLLGKHQIINCVTALETLNVLQSKGYNIDKKKLKDAIFNTTFYCRQEKIGKHPVFLVDGAHNADAVNVLKESLREYGVKNVVAIVSFMKDKDWQAILTCSSEIVRKFVFIELKMPRALKADDMKAFCQKNKIDTVFASSVEDAILVAKSYKDETVLVFGSLYLASQIRNILCENELD